jgi:hypothetical protein
MKWAVMKPKDLKLFFSKNRPYDIYGREKVKRGGGAFMTKLNHEYI